MRSMLSYFLCLLAGAATPFAIAPYSFWYIGVVSVAVLAFQLFHLQSKKALFFRSLAFGLGYFGVGVSWVFVSIYHFGSTSFPLAIILTSLFVFLIAFVFALPFIGLSYFSPSTWRLLLGFPLFWALSEWLRSWVFTGFPWLYLGYGHIDNPIAGWAPIGGVLFLGLIATLFSAVLANLFIKQSHNHIKIISVFVVVMFWVEGKSLIDLEWSKPSGEPIKVGVVQPNIPQELKWAPEFRQPTLEILNGLSGELWSNDWVIWPEAAIPDIYSRSEDYLAEINQKALETQTSLITGILYDESITDRVFYNSIIGLGTASGQYNKQRLVPFGEYVPLESLLRGLINFFDLPRSFIQPGSSQQKNIDANGINVASAICYEIVYPDLIADLARDSQAIVTISNDAWFGKSIGPRQHFHMARMRALETGRDVIRATNNGISAIISYDGSIKNQTEQFVRTYTAGEIIPRSGNTPYLIWKNYFLLGLLLVLLAGLIFVEAHFNADRKLDRI